MTSVRKRVRTALTVAVSSLLVVLVAAWLPAVGQERIDWTPMLEQLREQPQQEALTELVEEVLGRFEGDTSVLDPSRTVLACVGGGCLRPVLITPPERLVAGQTRSGPRRAYNTRGIVGLIGVSGGIIARDLEGLFLLKTNPDGSISLLDVTGGEVARLAAAHIDQVSVTPIPIPDPEGESVLLPARVLETRIEIEAPSARIAGGEAQSSSLFSIGRLDESGLFAGVVFSGAGR